MAFISEEALSTALKRGELLSSYILFGDDAYLKSTYLNKISKSIAQPEDVFNYTKFMGGCNLQEVYDAVMQLPVMNDRKCVILNDFDFEHCSKNDLDRLVELIGEIPPESTLIMYFDGVEIDRKKSTKFKKLVSAVEKSGGVAVSLDHRSRGQLIKMLCDGAQKRGCKMESRVAGYLVDMSGEDINLLANELTKLCAFVKDGVITREDVDNVCTKTVEADIYRLSRAILSCSSTEALTLLDELLFMRIDPWAVFYTVSGVFVDMYRLYTAKTQNKTEADVIRDLKYPKNKEFLIKNAGFNLKKMDFTKLKLCLDTLTNGDKMMKTYGSEPRRVLEELIVKLIYIIAKGEAID